MIDEQKYNKFVERVSIQLGTIKYLLTTNPDDENLKNQCHKLIKTIYNEFDKRFGEDSVNYPEIFNYWLMLFYISDIGLEIGLINDLLNYANYQEIEYEF